LDIGGQNAQNNQLSQSFCIPKFFMPVMKPTGSFLTHPKIIDGVVHSENGLVAQASRLPPVSAEDREVWASEVTSIDALHKITHQDSL